MKNLILICVLLSLLLANTTYPQDTLTLEPAVMLEVTNIMPIENNLMITTSFRGYSQWISIYDISNPHEPELIDNAFALRMTPGSPEHVNNEKITGAILFDDIVIWCTMHDIGHPMKGEMQHGPIELWGRRIGADEVLWQIEFFEEDDQRFDWPGNMVRYEDYLFLAGGEAGVLIYNMSDPADPELVDVLEYENYRIIIIEERLLIYAKPHPGHNRMFFRLFDLSNPEEPEQLGTFDFNDRYPYDYSVENVTYNSCLFLRNWSREDSSSILVLDVTSDDAPREAAIINLGRDLDIFYFCISDDRLFITPFRRSLVDIHNINDNYEIEHVATVSPERTPDGQFLVHDNKLIFSYFYYSDPEFPIARTYIYELPALSVYQPPTLHPSSFSITSYPNPFNSTTTINYSNPKASDVSLKLYDISGREHASLFNGHLQAGVHSLMLDGSELSTGTYLVEMRAGGNKSVKKMVLIK